MTTPAEQAALPAQVKHTGLEGQLYLLKWTGRGTTLIPIELVDCLRCAEDPLADMATMPGELPPHGPDCPSTLPSV